jgi:hypothetical protein
MNIPLEEYAAFWGCDPEYDREPRLPGDGYMFYNFAVEYNDPDFLRRFIPAIERTIQCVDNDVDKEGLGELLEYVQCLLKGKNYEYA